MIDVFLVFLRLGLTSFGGPIAHLAFFHDEFVVKRKWLHSEDYVDLVALCQFLPGPASSQVGMGIGMRRAGLWGAVLAWIGFTLPSALLLTIFAYGLSNLEFDHHKLHGLKIVAVAVVAHAVWLMTKKICTTWQKFVIAIISLIMASFIPGSLTPLMIITLSALIGAFLLHSEDKKLSHVEGPPINSKTSLVLVTLFFSCLLLLPLWAQTTDNLFIKMFDSFYRTGALVFGGGHVVLPLLHAELVPTGVVSNEAFVAGYGAAQAIPGPLFAFSSFLGAVSPLRPAWLGAIICLIAAFLPSFLLITGIIPFWDKIRNVSKIRFAIQGINAAVVGLLASALYSPVWTSAIFNYKDFILALFCFFLLTSLKAPSWLVVIIGAIGGSLLL